MKFSIFVFFTLMLSGCSKDYTFPQQSDIRVFNVNLLQVKTIEDKNINISSIYDKGDLLFEPVLAIQRKKLSEAEEELQPLVESGDPEAMFWMAKIIYRSSIKDTPKALALLKESAKTNPYAAMALFPNNEQCQMYFPSECSEKWVEQAKKLFLEDAKNGDVRAIFYKEKLKKEHSVYIDAIINAAKNNYFYPLVDYASQIINDSKSSQELNNLAIRLLVYAKEKNFVPAIESLMRYENSINGRSSEEYNKLIEQGVMLGSNRAWIGYEIKTRKDRNISDFDKYVVSKALYYFNGRDLGLSFIKPIADKNKLALANKKAQEMVDAVKDVIYIDGAHPRQD
ncbi:TPA: hypothetical protein ACX6R4_000162 [Photobacterium damselae]